MKAGFENKMVLYQLIFLVELAGTIKRNVSFSSFFRIWIGKCGLNRAPRTFFNVHLKKLDKEIIVKAYHR